MIKEHTEMNNYKLGTLQNVQYSMKTDKYIRPFKTVWEKTWK